MKKIGIRNRDIAGERFNKLVGIKLFDSIKKRWLFKCDCGKEKIIQKSHVINGAIKHCGCLRGTHRLTKTLTYHRWKAMKNRCRPSYHRSKDYYGRGIFICDKWLKFENFLKDMGFCPNKNLSLDRINNDKGYEPSNCRWASTRQQSTNRRSNKFLEFNGEKKTLIEWSESLGINRNTLWARLFIRKWTVEESFTKKVGK